MSAHLSGANLTNQEAGRDYEMPRYSEEFKDKIVQKMVPPNSQSVAQISRETGVCKPTLYIWKKHYQREGIAVPADPSNPENWNGEDKLAVVIETAALNEQELSEYCRKKGLYTEQVACWKEIAISGYYAPERLTKAERRELQQLKKKSRKTEKELRRKRKPLLRLSHYWFSKKAQAIGGDREAG